MRRYQTLFMFLLTLAVGAMFLIRVPQPQDKTIAKLETQIAEQQATISFFQSQPTALPSPTPQPTIDALNITPTLPQSAIPTPVQSIVLTPTSGITQVAASTSVDGSGCAVSPSTSFTSSDTIYGVATLANMQAGDQLTVRFTYDTTAEVIYEEDFAIQQSGSYCRWYVIEPDELGWGAGSYSISYEINASPPVTVAYSVSGVIPPPAPDSTEEAMDAGQ